jgi:hypothetical protein
VPYRRSAVVALALAIAACSDSGPAGGSGAGGSPAPVCAFPFIGDEAAEPEIELFVHGADGADHPVSDGAVLDIIEPPQGGRVIFVGARARNVSGCGLLLTGAIRDPNTQQVRFDTRTVNLEPDAEGWGSVELGNLSVYANIPVCANKWTEQDIFGGDFTLEMKLVDPDGKTVEKIVPVTAACTSVSQAETPPDVTLAGCYCTCKGGYVTGETCEGGGNAGGAGGGS